jgi:hypothetical protein
VASFDDGGSGINPGDISRVLSDRQSFIGGSIFKRSDFNYDCDVDPGDISDILAARQYTNVNHTADFSCNAPGGPVQTFCP